MLFILFSHLWKRKDALYGKNDISYVPVADSAGTLEIRQWMTAHLLVFKLNSD